LKSFTEKFNTNQVKCSIIYCDQLDYDCPEIIFAKFLHECTRAMHLIHILRGGLNFDDINHYAPLPKPERFEDRFMLHGKTNYDEKNGYLVEHIIFGGIIIFITGDVLVEVKEDMNNYTPISLPLFAKIGSVKYYSEIVPSISEDYHLDIMNCQLWNKEYQYWEPLKNYYFHGFRWIRNGGRWHVL
jgi:hypothetical protein